MLHKVELTSVRLRVAQTRINVRPFVCWEGERKEGRMDGRKERREEGRKEGGKE